MSPGHDHQQGVRLGPQGRDARRAGDRMRRRRHRHRRRPGEHERVAARAAGLARRLSHGRREAGRHDDRRRPVGRLQPVPHGHHRRERREEVRRSRAPQQDEFAVASQNKAEAAQKAGTFKDEITPVRDPAAQGRSGRVRRRRVPQGRRDARGDGGPASPRSTRTARSPPATRPASTTAPPRCS